MAKIDIESFCLKSIRNTVDDRFCLKPTRYTMLAWGAWLPNSNSGFPTLTTLVNIQSGG